MILESQVTSFFYISPDSVKKKKNRLTAEKVIYHT